jgi:hypothetical protein
MRFHSLRFSVSFLSAAILTVGVVGLTSWTRASSREGAATDPHSPLGVAETLDSIVQPRFYKFDDERFGVSRIAVPVRKGHPLTRFSPENEEEKQRFISLFESKRDYMVMFYRTTAPPPNSRPYLSTKEAEFRYVIGTVGQNQAFQKLKPEWYPMVQGQLHRLNRGIPIVRETADWLLAMRPVKNNEQCVSCHVGSKPDDMLGIMVYAVHKKKPQAQQAAPALGPVITQL